MTHIRLVRSFSFLLITAPLALAACSGDSDADPATTTTTALESAQCTFKRSRGTEDTCFATYASCTAAANADAAACRTALQACLPKPPAQATSSSDNGRGRGGDHDRDGDHGGGRGDRSPHPTPDQSVVAACRTALDACLAAQKGDQTPCFVNHNKCVDEAFRAAFQAECDSSIARCADADDDEAIAACDALKKRCAEGVGARFAKGATPCP